MPKNQKCHFSRTDPFTDLGLTRFDGHLMAAVRMDVLI
jgi:hypothetical protein